MTDNTNKCIKCYKVVLAYQNSIKCDDCHSWIHYKCSELSKTQFLEHTNNYFLKFICQYCLYCQCGKCLKHVRDNQNGICCDSCNKWIHLKCSTLKLEQYKKLQENDIWYCKECITNIFPFSTLDNKKLLKEFDKSTEKIKQNIILIQESQNICKTCTVCIRTVSKPNKGIFCDSCQSLIHRRCSGMGTPDTINLLSTKNYKWECPSCTREKFPFSDIDDMTIQSDGFNSNFDCKCSTKAGYTIESNKYKFSYRINDDISKQ